MDSAVRLIDWWKKNGRDFPWRRESDPYKILVAEMMLHRTRAYNVVPVYVQFVNTYGSVKAVAEACEEDIRRIMKPIGLTRRVDKFIETFRLVAKEAHGKIPLEKDSLLKLPGIGDYISSAFRTFYGGNADPLIDTNTVRVLCRLKGKPINDSTRKGNEIKTIYTDFSDHLDSREIGYALIDFGSDICRPSKPQCKICPLLDQCRTGNPMNRSMGIPNIRSYKKEAKNLQVSYL
jgi:A/G-specific adenine glycosylase